MRLNHTTWRITIGTLLYGALLLCGQAQAEEAWDPLERMNRKVFWFNDQVDIYLLGPVARRYDKVTPRYAQNGVSNFFNNLKYPIRLASDLLQAKFGQAAAHTGRFLINSTVGVLGLADVANDLGLEDHKEDLGTAFGYWGVPSGPYLVVPFLGPSNLRDLTGFGGEIFLDPIYYTGEITNLEGRDAFWTGAGLEALYVINLRAQMEDAIKAAKESAVDYYLFTQSAYEQYRNGLIYDGMPPEEDELE